MDSTFWKNLNKINFFVITVIISITVMSFYSQYKKGIDKTGIVNKLEIHKKRSVKNIVVVLENRGKLNWTYTHPKGSINLVSYLKLKEKDEITCKLINNEIVGIENLTEDRKLGTF